MEKYIKNHQQHKKNQLYFGSDSEIYISYIISKIISLSITQSEFSFGGCKTKECALIKNTLLTKSIDKQYIESPRSKPITKEKSKVIIPAGSSFDLIK